MNSAPLDSASSATPRQALRRRLLVQRETFSADTGHVAAIGTLEQHLRELLAMLEPASLGLYWPHRREFNAVDVVVGDPLLADVPLALPFSRRAPVEMHYRRWNRVPPSMRDDCGIPAGDGAAVVPEVVLVPCVGFTATGHRLGYGAGYFDRWLAQHPGVTAVGVAWAFSEIGVDELAPQPHDMLLSLVVTERGVVG